MIRFLVITRNRPIEASQLVLSVYCTGLETGTQKPDYERPRPIEGGECELAWGSSASHAAGWIDGFSWGSLAWRAGSSVISIASIFRSIYFTSVNAG